MLSLDEGIAIGRRYLVDALLEQGLLCQALNASIRSEKGYYVVRPQRKGHSTLVERFVEWLGEELSRQPV